MKIKKIIPYFCAFIIPILIILGYTIFQEIIIKHNFFNNGETFLVGDMHQQYISVLSIIILIGIILKKRIKCKKSA